MAKEITGVGPTGSTLYAQLLNPASERWNGSAFETFASANYSTYVIVMTEQGASGYFIANFPSGITSIADYQYVVYRQMGGSAAEGDPVINIGDVFWGGTQSFFASMSGFKALFERDFVYGSTLETIKDNDIVRAFQSAINIFNQSLWPDTGTAQNRFYYLAAHYLCLNIQAVGGLSGVAGGGTESRGRGSILSKGAGGLNLTYAELERITKSPMLSDFLKTEYGRQYVQTLAAYLPGGGITVVGEATVDDGI